jgi:hypothetical protein
MLALAAAMLAAGLTPLSDASPAAAIGIPPIAVVGDSLIYQAEHGSTNDPAQHHLTDQLNKAGWSAMVRATSGADTGTLSLWTNWPSPPAVIVMAVGTNDRRVDATQAEPEPLERSIANVRSYLDRWPSAIPVLVGIVETAPRGLDVTGPEWNAWLRAEAQARGGVFVDWAGYSAGHPDWFTTDLLHQTAAGQAGYRAAIVAGAASSGIPVSPTTRPGPVTGLRAAAATQTRIDWRWNAVPGASYYKVMVVAGTTVVVNTRSPGGRYLFTAARPGRPYRIWVRAERTGVGTVPYATLVTTTAL